MIVYLLNEFVIPEIEMGAAPVVQQIKHSPFDGCHPFESSAFLLCFLLLHAHIWIEQSEPLPKLVLTAALEAQC